MDEIVLRGSFCVDFTKTAERSRVDYWIVKEEFTSRSQTPGTSLRFIVMVLSVSERQMLFSPSTSSLLVFDWVRVLDQYISTVRLPHYGFL